MDEDKIIKTLIEMEIPANLSGFEYIVRACQVIAESPKAYIVKGMRLFEKGSEEYGLMPACVERAIRYAISQGNVNLYPMAGVHKTRNLQFLYGLYYNLK